MISKDRALGYQQVAATALTTLTAPAGTNLILVTPEAQAVRWRDDGTAPTASIGYPLPVGGELRYTGNQTGVIQFIGQTAGAILNVVYYEKQGDGY